MTLGLRNRLLFAALCPPVGVAVLATFAPSPAVLAAAAVAAGLVAAGGVVLLTRDFGRLQTAADAFLRRLDKVIETGEPSGGFPVAATDGTGTVATGLAEAETSLITLGRLLRQREAAVKDALGRTAKALAAAADGRAIVPLALPSLSCPNEAQQLTAAVAKLTAAHAAANKRAAAFLGILHDIPDPVLVLDAKTLELAFQNTAAERFYPHLDAHKKKPTLDQFFAEPVTAAVPEHDAPTVAGPAVIREWLVRGNGGLRTGSAAGPGGQNVPVEVAATPQFERKSTFFVTALVRDLSAARETEAASRRRQRQLVGQRICRLLSRESKPALAVIRTQANLLSQAAKQIGQRDRLLPKVQRITEEACRQELVVDMLDWMGALSAGQVGEPDIEEVRIGDIAKAVGERLRPGFEERGNTLEVADEAGWVLADEDWMAAMVTGLLAHANQACERGVVRLVLGRRTAVQAHDEFAVLTVSYPGKPLPAHLVDDVRDPFRRPDSVVFDPDRPCGLLLGLAVANKLAGLMYGEFLTDADADGRAIARVVIPTRIGKPRAAEMARVAASAEPLDDRDMLGMWGVGGGGGPAAAEADDEAVVVATATAPADDPLDPPTDDTLANWFGGPSD